MALPPIPPGPDPALLQWSRVQDYAGKLFEAIDRLDEAGGSARVVEVGGWSVAAIDRALGTLLAAREGLNTEIARLESRRRHHPRRRRGVGRSSLGYNEG